MQSLDGVVLADGTGASLAGSPAHVPEKGLADENKVRLIMSVVVCFLVGEWIFLTALTSIVIVFFIVLYFQRVMFAQTFDKPPLSVRTLCPFFMHLCHLFAFLPDTFFLFRFVFLCVCRFLF